MKLAWVPCNPQADIDDHDSIDDLPPDRRASRRSLPPIGAASVIIRMSSPEIDASLTQIDEWYPQESSELKKGVFSVFPAISPEQRFSESDGPPIPASDRGRLQSLEYGSTLEDTPGELSVTTLADTPGQATSATDEARFQSTSDPPRALNRSAVLDTVPAAQPLQPDYQSREDVDKESENTFQNTLRQQLVHAPSRHLDAMPMPSKQKRLIHHWVTFTSRKIVLLDEPHNPCRTMMLPMALKGLVSKEGDSNADVAIFMPSARRLHTISSSSVEGPPSKIMSWL